MRDLVEDAPRRNVMTVPRSAVLLLSFDRKFVRLLGLWVMARLLSLGNALLSHRLRRKLLLLVKCLMRRHLQTAIAGGMP